jgi:dienelactone hydrolase
MRERMCRCHSLVPVLAGLVGLGACAAIGAANDPDELTRTWDSAHVRIPGAAIGEGSAKIRGLMGSRDIRRAMADIPPTRRLPTVIYLHGCDGMGPPANKDIDNLSSAGYAVIAPDSFGRQYRPRDCDPSTNTADLFPQVWEYRQAEIRYAAQRVRELPWVDQANVFLMGFSEGGIAAAIYLGDEFKGHIITGWTCHAGERAWHLRGIGAPPSKPILAVVASDDPWFRNPWNRGHCGVFMESRPRARSIVIPASVHHVTPRPAAWRAVVEFLGQHASTGK